MYILTEDGVKYAPKPSLGEKERQNLLEKNRAQFLKRTGVLQTPEKANSEKVQKPLQCGNCFREISNGIYCETCARIVREVEEKYNLTRGEKIYLIVFVTSAVLAICIFYLVYGKPVF